MSLHDVRSLRRGGNFSALAQGKAGIASVGMLLLLALIVWMPVGAANAHETTWGLAGLGTGTMQPTSTRDPAIVAAIAKEQLRSR